MAKAVKRKYSFDMSDYTPEEVRASLDETFAHVDADIRAGKRFQTAFDAYVETRELLGI